jgi:hypothetical protein
MHRYRQTLLLVTPEKGVNNNAICSVCLYLVLSFILSEKNRKKRWTMYWRFDLKIREQFIVSAFSLTVWPVFIQKNKWKKRILPKFSSTCSLFDCRSFPIWNLKLMRIILIFFCHVNDTLLHWRGKCTECIVIDRLCY